MLRLAASSQGVASANWKAVTGNTVEATPMGFDSVIANSIFKLGLYPVLVLEPAQPGKDFRIPYDEWPQLLELSKTKSLRTIAEKYGVSHEAIRRTLRHYNELSKVTIL